MMSEWRKHAVVPAVVGLSMLWACAPGQPSKHAGPDAVAVFIGGEISVDELDAAILELPPAQLLVQGEEERERDRQLIKVLAVDDLLLDQVESAGLLTSTDFVTIHEENRQRAVADFFIQRRFDPREAVTDSDVVEYFREHPEQFKQTARRLVSHIFRRTTEDVGVEEATEELLVLRGRVLKGESFSELAREYSDSETGIRGGDLGWLDEEAVPPGLEEIVFSLEPGIPSRPIVTSDGVHLFLVEAASGARTYTVDEVGSRIANMLVSQRRNEFIESLVGGLEEPEPYFVADREGMEILLNAGDPQAEVFQIGESSLTVARFREILDRTQTAQKGGSTPDLSWTLFDALVQRARIYEHCRVEGVLDEPELQHRLEMIRRDDAVNFLRERALTEEVNLDVVALEAYFDANRSRFSSPLILDLEVLVVPIPDSGANAMMARLSGLPFDSADDRLENAATEFGGRVETFEAATIGQIRRWNPKVVQMISGLEISGCSQPVRVGQSVVVVEVTDRVEPESPVFATVRSQVASAYLTDHRREIYLAWSERILDEAEFEYLDERLEEFWSGERGIAP